MRRSHAILILAGFVGLLSGCGSDKVAPPTKSLTDGHSWSPFSTFAGGAVITPLQTGFQLTNQAGNQGTFASAAFFFDQLIDISRPYHVTMIVRGINGAKNLGVTAVRDGENANPDTVTVPQQIFALTGQTQTISFNIPTNSAGLMQLALHFGYEFGDHRSLGNPFGSGVIVQDIQLNQGAIDGVPTLTTPLNVPSPVLKQSTHPDVVDNATDTDLPSSTSQTPLSQANVQVISANSPNQYQSPLANDLTGARHEQIFTQTPNVKPSVEDVIRPHVSATVVSPTPSAPQP